MPSVVCSSDKICSTDLLHGPWDKDWFPVNPDWYHLKQQLYLDVSPAQAGDEYAVTGVTNFQGTLATPYRYELTRETRIDAPICAIYQALSRYLAIQRLWTNIP